ncbi:MAG TPA: hypothetical protein VN581_14415 [Patescibacteria group bacterium]|nr:hypothetical protein [Patescibacteria group bacterium]
MRVVLLLPLLCAPWVAVAQSPDEDEKRIEEIVHARYGPTQAEIDALALQGLGPDGQPLIDPATGLPVVPGPDMVLTPTTEPAPTPPVAETAPEAPPPPDLPPIGPIQFEDLSKLVGQWVKLKTYNGRTWQGQIKAVKGNEVQLTVTQRSGAALMTLKKNAIASLERI